jgi:hypothetical protein
MTAPNANESNTGMSRELICSVLGVPVTSWPPDHYTLIGLSPDHADVSHVESRVQELSARLRPYQLAHPEEVTEALNRLAQALVCLSDPIARMAYDAARSDQAIAPVPLRPADATVTRISPSLREAPPETVADSRLSARRRTYRRLALLRQLRIAWLDLGRWFGVPAVKVTSLTEAVELLRAAWALRDLAEKVQARDVVSHEGTSVVELARQPHVLRGFRRMNSSRRADLAANWRSGLANLDREMKSLRDQVRRRRTIPRGLVKTARFLVTDGIDLTLFALGLIAIGIALWRSRH